MATVFDLLEKKGHEVLAVGPDATVREAIEKMAEMSAGTSLVMEGYKVVGIVAERDVIRKILLQDKNIDEVKVRDIMTTDVTSVSRDTPLEECLKTITEKRIRHLPVICGGQVCGIVSIGDLVKYLIVEKESLIRNLETYITGAL